MKKFLTILFILAIASTVQADWMGYYTTADNIRVPLISIDTLGRDLAPDSIHLLVHYHDEATANSASYTARFATAGAGSSIIDSTTLGGKTYYYFFDAVADIDNGEGDGNYACELAFFVQGEPHHKSFSFAIGNAPANVLAIDDDANVPESLKIGLDGSITTYSEGIAEIITDVTGINGWVPIVDNESLIVDQSTMVAVGDTNQLDLSNYDGATPLVVGDNIGINWGDVANPGATVGLAATTVNSVTGAGVTSIGQGVIDSNSLNATFKYKFWAYDDSTALNLGNELTTWLINNLGAAGSSPWTTDTRDSMLTGLWRASGGSANIWGNNIGINWGDVSNPGATVNLAATTVNSVTSSNVASAAPDAFDGEDFASSYWDSIATRSDSGATGSSPWSAAQRDSLLRNAEDRALSLAKFDTAAVAVFYAFGIWLDDAAANTNTTVGVDGTLSNPVSTVAAARILADSMGLMKYYIINNSSFTLDATHEDWDFIGIGESNQINFGSQDVDNSHFEHLMVAGVQGGTGLIWLNECYLNAADSLECVARNSWFSDTVSVRVATNIIFDNCFSAIPGNTTPAIDFNSAAGTVTVNFRHYSGGMGFLNGNSNHTISIETDGQIIIDASCTSINITARGNMTITDNGTTTSLTDAGVVNNNRLKNIISVVESQRLGHTHQTTGNIFYVDPTNGDTHANGNRGGINDPYAGVQDCHDNAVTDSNHDLIILLAGAASSTDTLIEAVTLSKRYLFIRGPGRDFIWTRSGNGNTITITADGIELSGFQLETAATGTGNGVDLTDADFLKVHSVWINATQGDGINILRGDNAQICCNHFSGTGVSGAGQGIDIVGTAGTSNGNVIEDNIFRDAAGDAIQISGGTTINTTIKNNVIEGSTAWGIDIGASSVDAFITDNRFGNNSSGSISDNGTTTVLLNNEQWGTVAAIAAYPPYTYKMVVVGSPTTIQFAVDFANIIPTPSTGGNDFCLGMEVQAQNGNSDAKMVTIADFTIADSTFTVRPGFASAPTVGDTMFIRPGRGGVEPSIGTQHEILLSGTGRVRTDSVETRVRSFLDSVATNAITDLAISQAFSQEVRNFIWANMDTSLFPTDSSDFIAYLTDRFTGSVSLPDSLLEMIAVADSILTSTGYSAGISILAKLGGFGVNERGSTDSTAHVYIRQLVERLGPFGDSSVSSTPFTVFYWIQQEIVSTIDSIFASLGFDTTPVQTKLDNLSLTGGGTEPETLIVLSTADSSQIQGARITVRTIDQSTVKVPGLTTDVNGKRILELDSDSFFVAVTANNYTQTLDTIVVAAGGQTDTLFMVLFSPSAPSGDLCTVYNWVKDGNDNPIKGVRVTAKIAQRFWPIRFDGQAINATHSVETDSTGLWELGIYPSTILTTTEGDSSSYWQISAYLGSKEIFPNTKVTVPDSATFLMVPDSE